MLVPAVVDALEVVVIVDNATDSLSTNPPGVTSELRWLMTGGRMTMTRGHCWRALAAIVAAAGSSVVCPLAVGKRYSMS